MAFTPRLPCFAAHSLHRQRGKMRDAQVDAIKTYLYLKIECQDQPLAELFKQG